MGVPIVRPLKGGKSTYSEKESSWYKSAVIDDWCIGERKQEMNQLGSKLEVAPINDKMSDGYLRWYDYVHYRSTNMPIRSDLVHVQGGKRNRGKVRNLSWGDKKGPDYLNFTEYLTTKEIAKFCNENRRTRNWKKMEERKYTWLDALCLCPHT